MFNKDLCGRSSSVNMFFSVQAKQVYVGKQPATFSMLAFKAGEHLLHCKHLFLQLTAQKVINIYIILA